MMTIDLDRTYGQMQIYHLEEEIDPKARLWLCVKFVDGLDPDTLTSQMDKLFNSFHSVESDIVNMSNFGFSFLDSLYLNKRKILSWMCSKCKMESGSSQDPTLRLKSVILMEQFLLGSLRPITREDVKYWLFTLQRGRSKKRFTISDCSKTVLSF
jgi:hypothetical protein